MHTNVKVQNLHELNAQGRELAINDWLSRGWDVLTVDGGYLYVIRTVGTSEEIAKNDQHNP